MENERRVFGPPGTGKSSYLAGYIDRDGVWHRGQVHVAAEKYGGERVLVTSFTRAAAIEIGARDTGLPKENIGTLHSMAYQLMGRPPIADLPKHVGEFNQAFPHFRLSGGVDEDGDAQPIEQGATRGDALLQRYNRLRAEMLPVPPVADLQAFITAWEGWKTEAGRQDFTDLLNELLKYPYPPHAAKVLFVDEAQDLTPLQFAIVRKWAPQLETLVLAGDDDQILYEHLGASPEAFLLPPVEDAHKRVLAQSYRVPAAIHQRAQAWIERVAFREPKEYRPRDEEGEVERINASIDHPQPAIADAEARIAAGQSVMFLATCGYMLNKIKAELRSAAIPFWNPYKQTRGDWNPLRTSKGPAQRVVHFLGGDEGAWTAKELADWVSVLRSDGVLARGAKAELDRLASADGKRILAAEEWQRFIEPDAWQPVLDGNLEWFRGALMPSKRDMHLYAIDVAQRRGPDALATPPKVIIGTVHSVKGGEADAVYVFPDLSLQGVMSQREPAGRDSIRRQFYVAMTRAKQSLLLPQPASANAVQGL